MANEQDLRSQTDNPFGPGTVPGAVTQAVSGSLLRLGARSLGSGIDAQIQERGTRRGLFGETLDRPPATNFADSFEREGAAVAQAIQNQWWSEEARVFGEQFGKPLQAQMQQEFNAYQQALEAAEVEGRRTGDQNAVFQEHQRLHASYTNSIRQRLMSYAEAAGQLPNNPVVQNSVQSMAMAVDQQFQDLTVGYNQLAESHGKYAAADLNRATADNLRAQEKEKTQFKALPSDPSDYGVHFSAYAPEPLRDWVKQNAGQTFLKEVREDILAVQSGAMTKEDFKKKFSIDYSPSPDENALAEAQAYRLPYHQSRKEQEVMRYMLKFQGENEKLKAYDEYLKNKFKFDDLTPVPAPPKDQSPGKGWWPWLLDFFKAPPQAPPAEGQRPGKGLTREELLFQQERQGPGRPGIETIPSLIREGFQTPGGVEGGRLSGRGQQQSPQILPQQQEGQPQVGLSEQFDLAERILIARDMRGADTKKKRVAVLKALRKELKERFGMNMTAKEMVTWAESVIREQ